MHRVPQLLERLGIRYPIVLAPMGGGPGTPALAAAVSKAGGLGSLAGAYLSAGEIKEQSARVRALTDGPLNLNLFAGGYHRNTDLDPTPLLDILGEIHAELHLPAPVVPSIPPDPFTDQLEAVLVARPEVFSFTFGIPSPDAMRAVRSAGISAIGTATTSQEAEMLADAGVDAIVAQGAEAGAHRGTFTVPHEEAMVPTLELVRQTVRRVSVPVIASGGLMTGSDVAMALQAGAEAVQLGTAFLACPEAGTSEAYRRALTNSTGDDTTITRAFSGRAARGIANRFTDLIGERDELILPFPIQNSLTRPMRAAAAQQNRHEYLSLWAGTGVAKIRNLPAAELLQVLVRELCDADPQFNALLASG
jgi:nitronate monooxygenase